MGKDKRGCLLVWVSLCIYITNVTTVILDVGFPAILAIRLAIRLKFFFTICTRFEQCTYLGFVLLEAPCEYVLHGPLLSIYWLRLCPHLGGPHPKPRRLEEIVYSPNDCMMSAYLYESDQMYVSAYLCDVCLLYNLCLFAWFRPTCMMSALLVRCLSTCMMYFHL